MKAITHLFSCLFLAAITMTLSPSVYAAAHPGHHHGKQHYKRHHGHHHGKHHQHKHCGHHHAHHRR